MRRRPVIRTASSGPSRDDACPAVCYDPAVARQMRDKQSGSRRNSGPGPIATAVLATDDLLDNVMLYWSPQRPPLPRGCTGKALASVGLRPL